MADIHYCWWLFFKNILTQIICASWWPPHRACRNSSRTQASFMGLASWMQAIFIKDWCFPHPFWRMLICTYHQDIKLAWNKTSETSCNRSLSLYYNWYALCSLLPGFVLNHSPLLNYFNIIVWAKLTKGLQKKKKK